MRTVSTILVSSRWELPKKNPAVLDKFLSNRLCLKLACELTGKLVELGYTLLQIYIFFFERLRLVADKREVLRENLGTPVLSDELIDLSRNGSQGGSCDSNRHKDFRLTVLFPRTAFHDLGGEDGLVQGG